MTSPRPPEFVVAEYEAAHSAYLHYDAFRWQAGSILVAASFVLLGFLASTDATAAIYGAAAVIVTLVMSIWLLYAYHYRQLYLFKIDRILELEVEMGAEQNRRFNPSTSGMKTYRPRGPSGHSLDSAVFAAASVSVPALAVADDLWTWWLTVPLAAALMVIVYTRRNDQKISNWLGSNRS